MPRTAMIKISASPYISSPRALPDHAHQLSACKLLLLQSDDVYMLFFFQWEYAAQVITVISKYPLQVRSPGASLRCSSHWLF